MKTVKLFSISFFVAVLTSCSHTKSSGDDTPSSEGLDQPHLKVTKNDSTTHNDTIVTPPDNTNENKNNPDITK
ncbi:MAG TPA: hypothetical protein VKG26_15135 [Bacteroidia bacterium]|nr:hypothetical protein [Bacteroidia bacterium]